MAAYQYQYGDRPLEGYTIQRAAGRGGFGEVYFAISDSGRQVAIKVIQNYEPVELRGISQCMNLKSPHLVTVFDVKHNAEGKPFVVMEYVAGPSLHDLLTASPRGLGEQKAAFFLREIAKGLSYLHECGIVHRDLKPGNIFYENGYVKIGDYGLSKLISAERHSNQTITVGTVHYMAPEIGAGCYDRSIDIYALGIILYEMLTGQVPYLGSSPAEVLMKHMTGVPDLTGIGDPFARSIRKALAKDPAERYQTVQQMVEDIFGAEHIRDSVSHFSPESLSFIAQRVAEKIPGRQTPPPGTTTEKPSSGPFAQLGAQIDQLGEKLMTATGDWKKTGWKNADWRRKFHQTFRQWEPYDPLSRKQRLLLFFIVMGVISIAVAGLSNKDTAGAVCATMICGATAGIILVFRLLYNLDSALLRRLATTGGAIFLAAAISSGAWHDYKQGCMGGTCMAMGVLFFENFWRRTDALRLQRITLGPAIWMGALAWVAAEIFHGQGIIAAGVVGGTLLGVQIGAPFVPHALRAGLKEKLAATPTIPKASPQAAGAAAPRSETSPWSPSFPKPPKPPSACERRYIPPFARFIWLGLFSLFLAGGLLLLIVGGMKASGDDLAITVALGVCSLAVSFFCLIRGATRYLYGWFNYLIRPVLMLLCLVPILIASLLLGVGRLSGDEKILALFMIIFPAIWLLVLMCIPSSWFGSWQSRKIDEPALRATHMISPYKRLWALILSAGIFMGFAGLHRFYVGKIGTGILWLLTGGVLGIGQLIDFVMILSGKFTDQYGFPLKVWESMDELKPAGETPLPVAHHNGSPIPPPPSGNPQPQVASTQAVDSLRNLEVPASAVLLPDTLPIYTGEPFSLGRSFLSMLAVVFVLAGTLLGLSLALGVPRVIAAGFPHQHLAEELRRVFGSDNWPQTLSALVAVVAGISFSVALVCVLAVRRHKGAAHLMRGVVGILAVGLALWSLNQFLPISAFDAQVIGPLQNQQAGLALENFVKYLDREGMTVSVGVFSLGTLLLAWPAARRPQVPVPPLPGDKSC